MSDGHRGWFANRLERLDRWSIARGIAMSRLPQASAAIPAIGYLILMSERFDEWLRLNPMLESVLWTAPPTLKLYLLWWGAVLMTAGWAIYRFSCPAQIRKYDDPDAFIEAVFAISNIMTVREAHKSFRDRAKGGDVANLAAQLGTEWTVDYISKSYGMSGRFWQTEKETTAKILQIYYHHLDVSKPFRRRVSLMLLIVGVALFLWPSFEVAAKIVIVTFCGVFGCG